MRYHLWRLRRELNALRRHIAQNRAKEIILADFTSIDATVTGLEASQAAVSAYVATLKAADDQAAVDALQARLATVKSNLDSLVPAPAASPEPAA
jgi:hypothetical protein